MPRKRTGTFFRWPKESGPFFAQVTFPSGKRSHRIPLGNVSEEIARKATRALQAKADRGELLPKAGPLTDTTTVAEWFDRWFDWRKEHGFENAENERGRFKKWVVPVLGDTWMVEVTTEKLEDLVLLLDRAALAHANAERAGERPDLKTMMSAKSAVNLWGVIAKGFRDATRSKDRALRVLKGNPAEGIEGPERGHRKMRSSLTPAKLLAVACAEHVPASVRLVVVLATYTGLRAAELRALTWNDVSFDEGVIDVHHTVDREGEAGTTKSERPRRVTIEPAIRPLLVTMRELAGGIGNVVRFSDDRHLARSLRTILEAVGAGGAELQRSATRAPLTWHDLRGTWCTWRAIRGDEPMRILAEAGHEDMATTLKYIRLGDVLRPGYGAVFPAIPEALLDSLRREALEAQAAETEEKLRWRRRESKSVGSDEPPGNSWDAPPVARANQAKQHKPERFGSESAALPEAIRAELRGVVTGALLAVEEAAKPVGPRFWIRFADEEAL